MTEGLSKGLVTPLPHPVLLPSSARVKLCPRLIRTSHIALNQNSEVEWIPGEPPTAAVPGFQVPTVARLEDSAGYVCPASGFCANVSLSSCTPPASRVWTPAEQSAKPSCRAALARHVAVHSHAASLHFSSRSSQAMTSLGMTAQSLELRCVK